MRKFVYYAPTEIVFGPGDWVKTAAEIRKFGGSRVFMIYGGHSAVKSGLIGRLTENLEEAGLTVMASGGVVPNPCLSTAERMRGEAVKFGADFILAVGGGSVIDTAKAVAHGACAPEVPIWDFWMKKAEITRSLPIGTVLTIAAAGSETSDSAVITNDLVDPPTKRGITTDFNRCRFAVMDPELTMTLPVWQIGAGAADIFMHTSERFFTTILGNHLTDEIAGGLFRDILKYGPIGVRDPKNYEAMSEIMWCGSISHVGLTGLGARGDTSRDGDWACHQLGMAMSAIGDYTHGATLTAVWGTWARYVMHENISRFAEFARMTYGITAEDPEKAAEEGITRTEEFFRALGMPTSLTGLMGHKPDEKELHAFTDECSYGHTRTIGTFKVLDDRDMLEIYRRAE